MRKGGRDEHRSDEGREVGGTQGVRDKGRVKGRVGVMDGERERERERGKEGRRDGENERGRESCSYIQT